MTAYFSQYPTTLFDDVEVTDLTIKLSFISKIKNNISLFQSINISDRDKPEDIAYRYYGDPELFWIVLLLNDIVDPYYDWLLSDEELLKYCQRKYGEDAVYDIHHYITTDQSEYGAGLIVSLGEPFSEPVSNFSYEQTLNEQKRKIKLIKRRYLEQILSEYKNELRSRD